MVVGIDIEAILRDLGSLPRALPYQQIPKVGSRADFPRKSACYNWSDESFIKDTQSIPMPTMAMGSKEESSLRLSLIRGIVLDLPGDSQRNQCNPQVECRSSAVSEVGSLRMILLESNILIKLLYP